MEIQSRSRDRAKRGETKRFFSLLANDDLQVLSVANKAKLIAMSLFVNTTFYCFELHAHRVCFGA